MAADPAPEYGQKFVLTGPDGTRAVFNDSTDVDFVGFLDPEECSGLDSAEVREDAVDRVEGDGGVQGTNLYGRRPVVLGGIIRHETIPQRAQRSRKLLRASNALRSDCALTYITENGAGVEVELLLRRNARVQFSKANVKRFMVPLVSDEYRILSKASKSGEAAKPALESKILAPASGSQEGGAAWAETAKDLASDNVYATASPGAGIFTNALVATFGNFAVPAGAVIRGVELRSEQSVGTAGNLESLMRMVVPGDGFATTMFNAPSGAGDKIVASYAATTTDVTKVFGANNQLWGRVLGAMTPTNINGGAVKAGIFEKPATAIQVRVDQLLAVFYYEVGVAIENAGDAPATPVIKIFASGATANPFVELIDAATKSETTGPRIQFNHVLEEATIGEYVEINLQEGTVIDAKGNDRSSWINFASTTWFTCSPGTTWLTSSTSKISATWKDAWS